MDFDKRDSQNITEFELTDGLCTAVITSVRICMNILQTHWIICLFIICIPHVYVLQVNLLEIYFGSSYQKLYIICMLTNNLVM